MTKMNHRQLAALWVGVGLMAAACLMPPWAELVELDGSPVGQAVGHAPLFSPPEPRDGSPAFGVRLDVGRLVLLLGVIAGATAASVFTLGRETGSGRHVPLTWETER